MTITAPVILNFSSVILNEVKNLDKYRLSSFTSFRMTGEGQHFSVVIFRLFDTFIGLSE